MTYEIDPTGTALTLIVDEDDLETLRQIKAEPEYENQFDCDVGLVDFLERLTCNSDLCWVDASETGDLTDAPMLGWRDSEGVATHRWAFMSYETISVQQRLLDTGKAVFVGGPLE